MKIKSIKLHNFMRYKGDNELFFSTDNEKNVTVVLGDNTFGKTTLAQAFSPSRLIPMLFLSHLG